MNFWIIAMGEPIPSDIGSPRLLRAGILASKISSSGVNVTWWNSSFDHTQKLMRASTDHRDEINSSYKLRLLHGEPYRSNVSIDRIVNHVQVANDFARRAPKEAPPDLIFAAYPTIELCEAALEYARPRGIPVVVDVRDLWPDIFVNLIPRWARLIGRTLLSPMFSASKRVVSGATAITGITDAFVDWGISRANRNRHDWDRAFPLAYQDQLPASSALELARIRWDSYGLTIDKPIVCFFGTLGRQFDIPCVIAAGRHLAGTPLQIVICGCGDHLVEYSELASDLPNVHFPGWVDAPEIYALMERSLAGLAPYYNELSFTMSLPNKSIEYLSGGLPIISNLRGELELLLRENECGVTAPEGDSSALAEVFRDLLIDKLKWKNMSENARRLYEKNFTADVVYGKLLDHLQLIATQHTNGMPPFFSKAINEK